ncbi:hypothetical protein CR513_36176, partial [Mucuna pruriens]
MTWQGHKEQEAACASRRVHEQVSSVTGVSPFAINPRARRRSFERRLRGPLEEPISKWVRDGPSQEASQADNHSVKAHVVVRCNQRWALRPVNWLVKWPRALTRALGLGVSDPNVSELVVLALPPDVAHRRGTVGPASARAETFNCHVGGG